METFVMRTSLCLHYLNGFTNNIKPSSIPLSCFQNPSQVIASKLIRSLKHDGSFNVNNDKNSALLTHASNREMTPLVAWELLCEMKSQGYIPDQSLMSSVMICCANNGFFPQAQAIWDEMLYSSFSPSIDVVSKLINAYGKMGHFDEVTAILDQLSSRNYELLFKVYTVAVSCFGKHGQLELMEKTLKKLVMSGFSVDSATGNAFIIYYSSFGSLMEMETAYARFRSTRILIEEEAIRAVALAYIKEQKFYKLGEFLRGVGLGRRNVGNLLWNLLLLSYAGNFKMKSLQREFLGMLNAGFRPDLTTFNIRALAFSKMSLFWDLHLSLEHMEHEHVIPDLVTYGCVVDAYFDKGLGRNLDFAFRKMNLDDSPLVLTDPFVFEVLGKGDFQSSSEAFLEFKTKRTWTYRDLVAIYLKKKFRRNQIFWNY